MTRPEDIRYIEAMAKAMAEYDRNAQEKTWRELAEVAYNAMVRHSMAEYMENRLAQLQQRLYQQ